MEDIYSNMIKNQLFASQSINQSINQINGKGT